MPEQPPTAAPDLASLQRELTTLRISDFNNDLAWALGVELRARAVAVNAPVAIEVRHGNDVVFATLVGGATIDNFGWTRRKSATSHRFQRSSLAMRLEAEQNGYDFNDRYALPASEFSAYGGSVPLFMTSGTYVGSVAVSGLPDVEDHRLIISCLERFKA